MRTGVLTCFYLRVVEQEDVITSVIGQLQNLIPVVIDKSPYIQREVDMQYLRVSSFSSGVRQLAILKGDRVVREVLVLGEKGQKRTVDLAEWITVRREEPDSV